MNRVAAAALRAPEALRIGVLPLEQVARLKLGGEGVDVCGGAPPINGEAFDQLLDQLVTRRALDESVPEHPASGVEGQVP